jgi:hypothetical protein
MNEKFKIAKKELEHLYYNKKLPLKKICKKFGCSTNTIKNRMEKWNLDRRPPAHISKYFCNEDFFTTPNLKNCYWAGFIAADGCILDRERSQKTLDISVHEKDRIILCRFKNDINFNGKIFDKTGKRKTMSSLRINSFDKTYVWLNKNFNITPRKTKTLAPPNLKHENLIKAFIIGYIDGDGCIRIRRNGKRNQILLNVVGTFKLLNWIRLHFNKWVPIVKSKIKFERKGVVCSYTIVGTRALKILTELKKLDILSLDRKWDKII